MKSGIRRTMRRKVSEMRGANESSGTLKAGAKTRSRKGSQAAARPTAKRQGRTAGVAGSAGRKSPTGTVAGQK